MNYTYPPEEYASKLVEYYELEKLTFSPDESRETILRKLEEKSAKKRVIAGTVNTMIREYIETFEKDPEAATAEDVEKLDVFIRSLQTGQGFNTQCPDPAIMLRAQRIRKAYFERTDDLEELIGCLSNCNHYYLTLFALHSSSFSSTPYFDEILKYVDRFAELSAYRRAQFMTVVARMAVVQARGFDEEGFTMDRVWRACRLEQELFDIDRAVPPTAAPDPRAQKSGVPGNYGAMLLQNCMMSAVNAFSDYCVHEKDAGRVADVEAMRPLVQPLVNALRDDEVLPSLPREAALQNAPRRNDEAFVVPKIIA